MGERVIVVEPNIYLGPNLRALAFAFAGQELEVLGGPYLDELVAQGAVRRIAAQAARPPFEEAADDADRRRAPGPLALPDRPPSSRAEIRQRRRKDRESAQAEASGSESDRA